MLSLLYHKYVLGQGWRLVAWPQPRCEHACCAQHASLSFLDDLMDALQVLCPAWHNLLLLCTVLEFRQISYCGHCLCKHYKISLGWAAACSHGSWEALPRQPKLS